MSGLRAMTMRAKRRAGGEHGFTLIELLVTMTISIIIIIALFAYQDVALRQTSSVFTRVDATQTARNVLANVERELSTACVSESVAPIRGRNVDGTTGDTSNATQVTFINGYGSAASVTPTKNVIALNTTTNQLTQTTYAVSAGVAPNWTFSTTPSSTTVLTTRAFQQGSKPVFTYFGYGVAKDSSGNDYLDSSGNPYKMLLDGSATLPGGITTSSGSAVARGTVPANQNSPLTVPLSAANAANAAAVKIDLRIGSSGGNNVNTTLSESKVDVSNEVVLRLTPSASDSSSLAVGPCR